jgi:protein-S-isoprenylcysteine O-methyltransferase Ste14
MTDLRVFAFSMAVITFGSFVWAAVFFFRLTDSESRKAYRIVSQLAWPAILIETTGILYFEGSRLLVSLGNLLFAASIALFWSAVYVNKDRPLAFAFSRENPTRFLRSGPYKFVRHPIYAAYSLAWLAGPLVTAKWWMLAIFLLMGTIYYKAARLEEMSFRDSAFSREYEEYRKATGMFVPKLEATGALPRATRLAHSIFGGGA